MGTSSMSAKVVVSATSKVAVSKARAREAHEGAESGHRANEGRVDGSPATDAMEVDMTGQV